VYHLVVTTSWRPHLIGGRLRAAFIAASVAWAALLVAVPFLASRAHASGPASLVIVAVYVIGGFICHQLPARSYQLWSAQMPVCARCAGIYFGAVIGAVAAAIRRGRPWSAPGRSKLHPYDARVVLAAAAAPTIATLVYEWTTGVMPAHGVRAAAGAAIGAAVAWVVVAAADNQVN
jgi:hypothetical protein